MRIPDIREAISLLEYAETKNRGPWVAHSYCVADCARRIARACKELDEEAAYVMGLLHDIGRIEGFSYMHHIISGYNFLKERGYTDAAKVSLTHSFPTQDIRAYIGQLDCSEEEVAFVKDFLSKTVFDDYDRLIQLCDSIALPQGPCLMEKRLVDVVLRYDKLNSFIITKWRKYFELKDYFELKIGKSVYILLDNVIENTFGFYV